MMTHLHISRNGVLVYSKKKRVKEKKKKKYLDDKLFLHFVPLFLQCFVFGLEGVTLRFKFFDDRIEADRRSLPILDDFFVHV